MASMLSLTGLVAFLFAPTAGATGLTGSWEGKVGPQGIRTVLHLSQVGEGSWVGTVDSPEQSAFGLDRAEIEFDGTALRFAVPATHARWVRRRSSALASDSPRPCVLDGDHPAR